MNDDFTTRIGPLKVDWPRSIGYFGGVWLAVTCDVIAPPLGVFIAAIPLLKLFEYPNRRWPVRLVAHTLEGAAKPVGGAADATVRVVLPDACHEAAEARGPRPDKARRRGPRQVAATVRAAARER